MASIGAACEASQHETPQSLKVESRSQGSGYMREKRGREARGAAGRQVHMKDLLETGRGIPHPEPRCGIAIKKSLLARLDQCRSSLKLEL